MKFSDLPKPVYNRFILRFALAGLVLILGVVSWIVFKSFLYGFVVPLLLAAYIGISNFFLIKDALKHGIFELEGKITRMDRFISHKRLNRLVTRSDAPTAFWIISKSGVEAKVHPDSRRFKLKEGDYVRIYFAKSQYPRESNNRLIFSDYILYEQFSVNEEDEAAV